MSKQKFNEASVTTAVKGYLSNRRSSVGKKKIAKEQPWYLSKDSEIKNMVRRDLTERRNILEAGPERPLGGPEEHIQDLQRQLSSTKDEIKKDPEDQTLLRRVRSLEKEIKRVEKAVELGGEKWRDYLVSPEQTAKQKEKKAASSAQRIPAELRQSKSPYVSVIKDIISKFEADPESWKDVKNRHVVYSGLKLLKKYVGAIPSTAVDHQRIEDWVNNTLIGKYDGDLKAYAATREPKVGIRRPAQKMSVKTGKKASKIPVAATHTAEPMPGAIKDLFSLHRELEKSPEHKESPFSPPSTSGRGLTSDPGSGGRILKNVYEKIIRGIIDDPEYFKKVDPDALGIKKHELTRFEQALGPFLRNLYWKAGHEIPDEEGDPSFSPEKLTSLEPQKTPEDEEREKDEKVQAGLKAVDKFMSRQKAPSKEKSTKSDRRAHARDVDEPRDSEELARRREKEKTFRQAAQASKERLPVKQPGFGDLEKSRRAAEEDIMRSAEEEEQKKKELINLINKKRAEQMKTLPNESFNISELFEGFENSYELDAKEKEERWDCAKIPAKKNWTKELSLESLLPTEKK